MKGRDRNRPRLGSAYPIRRTRTRIFGASWCFLLWTLTLWFSVKLRLRMWGFWGPRLVLEMRCGALWSNGFEKLNQSVKVLQGAEARSNRILFLNSNFRTPFFFCFFLSICFNFLLNKYKTLKYYFHS